MSQTRKKPVRRAPSTNSSAFEVTLKALAGAGRVEPVDEALVQACRSMAEQLDVDPSNAALWRQYRETVAELTEADVDVDDGLADALAALRSATPVGNPPEG
jgi:phage tail protein X